MYPLGPRLALASLLAAGCTKSTPPEPPARPLAALFDGCAEIGPGPTCARPNSGELVVWIPAGPSTALVDGEDVRVETEAAGGGARLRFVVPEGARHLEVRAGGGRFALALADPPAPTPGPGDEGRAALRAGRDDEAVRLLLEGAAAHARAGRRASAARDLEAAAYVAIDRTLDFGAARERLAEAARVNPDEPYGQGLGDYYLGLLAWRTGDLRGAAAAFERARTRFHELGRRAQGRGVMEMEAVVARARGRGDAALRTLDDLFSASSGACERARAATNLGWLRLLERARRGPEAAADPEPPLAEAAALYAGECADARRLANVRINRALAALGRADAAAARARLAEVGDAADPGLRPWRALVEARLALADGQPRSAAARFEAMRANADAAMLAEPAWRAATGLGEALEAAGDPEAALAAYRDAEARLDDQALQVPIDAGRGGFLADRSRSLRRLVALLLARGDGAAALCAARLGRGRALRALARRDRVARLSPERRAAWERAVGAYRRARAALDEDAALDWTRPPTALRAARAARAARSEAVRRTLADALHALDGATARAPTCADLRPIAPDELWVVWAPSEAGARPLAARGDRVVAGPPGADDLRWLGELPESARRARLAPWGRLNDAPVHRWTWKGAPLADRLPVAFTLDAPATDEPPTAPTAAEPALVVVDPERNLRGARTEGEAVATALRAAGWSVETLAGGAARADAVRAALPGRRLFHYAGHGQSEPHDRWASRMPLADGGALTVGDILALDGRAPREVVLAGCETGLGGEAGVAGGASLAHAFLLAGAEAVVAATERVDDALAGRVGAAVAAARARKDPDLATALHRALGGLGHDPRAAAFRVWVR